ncbi:MAG: RHS repeat-associated core domain-containing protein, partial [Bacteroidota bacterium]
MIMPARTYQTDYYRFGFNGKEMDEDTKGYEGKQLDYGMRIYDPRVGRFLSIDPLTKKYPELTPYQFASNSPIGGIDLDGMEFLSSFASAQKAKFEREVQLQNSYKGPTFRAANPANKSFTQNWRDS